MQVPQLASELRLAQDELCRHEQEQQDRRMPLEREADVLAQAVRDEVEAARPGTDAFGLGALDEVLEAVEPTADLGRAAKPDQVLRRLDVDRHLVAVVLAAVVEAVDGRADGP